MDRYAEWDTWDTIHAVENAIALRHDVTLIEANEEMFSALCALRPELVFNIAEGMYGLSRESQVPAMLEFLQIPYTGSDPITLGICLDKARAKEILSYYKIPNAPFARISALHQLPSLSLSYPMIVKPIGEGSSKGIYSSSFVTSETELKNEVERILTDYHQEVLIEEFLPGREFTVAILGNGDEAKALPIVEISYTDFPDDFVKLYSFEAKWILDTKENPLDVFSCPANIDDTLADRIREICLRTYKILNCRDWSRIDVRLDKYGEPNIIEINPLPGILPDPKENSCYPKAARTAGLSYDEMILAVVESARRRYGI